MPLGEGVLPVIKLSSIFHFFIKKLFRIIRGVRGPTPNGKCLKCFPFLLIPSLIFHILATAWYFCFCDKWPSMSVQWEKVHAWRINISNWVKLICLQTFLRNICRAKSKSNSKPWPWNIEYASPARRLCQVCQPPMSQCQNVRSPTEVELPTWGCVPLEEASNRPGAHLPYCIALSAISCVFVYLCILYFALMQSSLWSTFLLCKKYESVFSQLLDGPSHSPMPHRSIYIINGCHDHPAHWISVFPIFHFSNL